MKKIMVLVMVVMMLVSGCAQVRAILDSGPVNFICNPTPAQQQTAALMLVALDTAQAVAAGFFPITGIIKASAVLTTIKNGGCFLVAELKEAFEAVDAANAALAKAQMKMMTQMAPATLPEYPDLRVLVK